MKFINQTTNEEIQLIDSITFNIISSQDFKIAIDSDKDLFLVLNTSDRLTPMKKSTKISDMIKSKSFLIKKEDILVQEESVKEIDVLEEIKVEEVIPDNNFDLEDVFIKINRTGLSGNAVRVFNSNNPLILLKCVSCNSDFMKFIEKEWGNLNFNVSSTGYHHSATSKNTIKFKNISGMLNVKI